MNKEFTKLFKMDGYKKNVIKIVQLAKIEICAVLFLVCSKTIILENYDWILEGRNFNTLENKGSFLSQVVVPTSLLSYLIT